MKGISRAKMCMVIGILATEFAIVYNVMLLGFSANTFCWKHSDPSKKAIKYRSSLSFSKSINGVSVQLRKPRILPNANAIHKPNEKGAQNSAL
jgi:hypothetical protein